MNRRRAAAVAQNHLRRARRARGAFEFLSVILYPSGERAFIRREAQLLLAKTSMGKFYAACLVIDVCARRPGIVNGAANLDIKGMKMSCDGMR